jgi:hypothetical protein
MEQIVLQTAYRKACAGAENAIYTAIQIAQRPQICLQRTHHGRVILGTRAQLGILIYYHDLLPQNERRR